MTTRFDHTWFHSTANFDPLTLAAIGMGIGGLGGAASAAASIFGPKPSTPQMPAQAPPAQSPTTTPSSTSTGSTPSFLAAAGAAPQQSNIATKSLLGQ